MLNLFFSQINNTSCKIGIGLGAVEEHDKKILISSLNFVKNREITVYLFGIKKAINFLSEILDSSMIKNKIILVESKTPEKTIIEHLKNGEIDAIIRGSLSSSKFLFNLKKILGIKYINRLALLETFQGFQFFYGPVGIDECNSLEATKTFIKEAIRIIRGFNITPKVSVLSGGRKDDVGRDDKVDFTIKEAIEVVRFFKEKSSGLEIFHDEILIEDAINRNANLIIAPEGISGNLIYRTLVHLGGGKAHGAIYMGLNKPIIDTSRVGHASEIEGALILATVLNNKL